VKRVKQFFTAAQRLRLIADNPFAHIKCGNFAENRFYFVSRQEAEAVLEECPDAEWRLIFALARFGGLRVPSEILPLEWGDVNWEKNRFTVRSPKTAHHDGKGSRVVPIFPELLPYLREAFEIAKPGARYVIARRRDGNANLRTQLTRIIERAGLAPWPKLFVNLRSTRETELAERFPLHVVTAWLGNSPDVARKHYLQTTEEHFDRAAGGKSAAESAALVEHFPQQQAAAKNCAELQEAPNF
jgi:integrase